MLGLPLRGKIHSDAPDFQSGRRLESVLRTHTPNAFKTPGTGTITVIEGDKILVLDEATRQKLIDREAERQRARLQS